MSLFPDSPADMFESESVVQPFVITAPTVRSDVDGQSVKELFEQHSDAEGVVVTDGGYPTGLVMRTAFFQKIASLYGNSLYMKRPISILMDTEFLKADVSDKISRLSILAMGREQSKLYDYVVVFKNKEYHGVISIRLFLMELSSRNEAQISVLVNQQRELISAHEQEILLRKNLEYQSAAVKNLLDHADQGFLWFGRDLVIKKDYSYKCKGIFNVSIGECEYIALVTPYFGEDKATVFRLAFESYFKNNSPVTDNVYLTLLPADCVIRGKHIHMEYRRIESGGNKAVMVILNDVTERVSLEKAMELDRNKQRLLIKAFGCQSQIKRMLDEFRDIFSGGYRSFFEGGCDFNGSLHELYRSVHTFKGDFAQYGFVSAANRLHDFEDALLGVIKLGEGASFSDVNRILSGAQAEQILAEDLGIIYDAVGAGYFEQNEFIPIPKARLAEIENELQKAKGALAPSAILGLIEGLRSKNCKTFLEQYRDYLQYLADRVMKSMPLYLVEGDDIYIDEDKYSAVLKALVHIYRNMMDHGIEADEERLEQGKDVKGIVHCVVKRTDDGWFGISIADDGRGIDFEKIKKKALDNGLYTVEELAGMTDTQKNELVFAEHISTKESADALSGRGMGMSAVREACRAMGGEIVVTTEKSRGTTFVMKLPLR